MTATEVKLVSKISEVRRRRNLSQRQLADCVGVSSNTIVSWEKKIPKNFQIAFALMSFFRREIEEVFGSNSLEALSDIGTLRRARLLGEISQVKLAEAISVSENTMSTWENKKHKTMLKLENLCKCLGCDLGDLYEQNFSEVVEKPKSKTFKWLKPI